jgi:ppGpp synthetase/RelA/SpoT-type nucleotidyltranferase
MNFPKEFKAKEYVKWHNSKKTTDSDLAEKIESLRNNLKLSATEDLQFLEQLFSYLIKLSKQEYKKEKNINVEYKSTLKNALNKKGDTYDRLFKSESSILNKLWRKNKYINTQKGRNYIFLSNIKTEITDLIRTEIVGDTLDSCNFLSARFDKKHIKDDELTKKYEKHVKKITLEPEMKMASGYFAYHILIHFKSGIIVEVQIYSEIVKKWRALSHQLYDIVRIASNKDHEFNSKEARLISLGHLFHLAECEIKNLQDEFNPSIKSSL